MKFVREPWAHQLAAIQKQAALSLDGPQGSSFALFMDPGVGKSSTAINIWRNRCNTEKRFLRTLVFCPPIVVPNWRDEFRLNSSIPMEKLRLLTGPGKRRVTHFHRLAFPVSKAQPQPGIFVTNYESLLMPELFELFRIWQPEAIIFDESHELKNYKAKRSKRAEELANAGPLIPFKQILTGSPVLKDAMDLFQQFLILDGGQTLGRNFFIFQARYFRDRNAGMPKDRYFPDWQLMTQEKDGIDGATALSAAIAPKSVSAKKAECMDLPPFVQTTLKVPMTSEQVRMYEEMKRDFITYMEGDACVATLAVTKALRMMQIASGYLKATESGLELPIDGAPKQEALKSLLAHLAPNHKVLVWAVWKNNYAQIRQVCEELNIKYVEINGEVSEKARNAAVLAINEDPTVRVLIGHPGSGGVGVNLVGASYSIFYSRTFSLKHSIQAEARNYRGGSEIHEKITRYDLVCENSIDELVSEALASKLELSDKLLRDLSLQLKKQES